MMNDRIRELFKTIRKYKHTYNLMSNPPQVRYNYTIEEQDIEKFAELIIRECTTICDSIGKEARKQWKTKYNPHDDGRSDGAWECEDAIKEHFGVEE